MNTVIEKELHEHLEGLPLEKQKRVLDYARMLAKEENRGSTGRALKQFGGMIPKDDLEIIKKAIEEDCSKVDSDEW